ncbi:MAG: hypothetical protein N2749_06675 [Clostridia bacterium]|nr:hypothetical protein [Clostridia bacterium]
MKKIEIINEYINKCNEVIELEDKNKASQLQDEIIAVYSPEIEDIVNGLDNYSGRGLYDESFRTDFIKDLNLLRAKLINYKSNIEMNEERDIRSLKNKEYDVEVLRYKQLIINNTNNNNTTVSNNNNNITNAVLTIDNVLKRINQIKENEKMSEIDKENMISNINEVKALILQGNNEKANSKLKDFVKFIIDKAIPIGADIILQLGTVTDFLSKL